MTQLRAARPGDLDALVALETELFGAAAWSRAVLADELAAESRRFVVEEGVDGVCGYAVMSVAGDLADLHRIAVAAGRQRHGVATRLLSALRDRCESVGCTAMLLEVAAGNRPALKFYARAGFREIDRRRRYYADGQDAVVMRLALAAGSVLGLHEDRLR